MLSLISKSLLQRYCFSRNPARESLKKPALPALTAEYQRVTLPEAPIFLHWPADFPALTSAGEGAGLVRRAAFCSLFTAGEQLFTADERLFTADECFSMAGKTVFQGLKIRQSRLEERLTTFLKDVNDALLTSYASAGKMGCSVQEKRCFQQRNPLTLSGQCRKCRFYDNKIRLTTPSLLYYREVHFVFDVRHSVREDVISFVIL